MGCTRQKTCDLVKLSFPKLSHVIGLYVYLVQKYIQTPNELNLLKRTKIRTDFLQHLQHYRFKARFIDTYRERERLNIMKYCEIFILNLM